MRWSSKFWALLVVAVSLLAFEAVGGQVSPLKGKNVPHEIAWSHENPEGVRFLLCGKDSSCRQLEHVRKLKDGRLAAPITQEEYDRAQKGEPVFMRACSLNPLSPCSNDAVLIAKK